MILSQLVDADELKALSPEELRNMILKLDDEVVYGSSEVLTPDDGKSTGDSTKDFAAEPAGQEASPDPGGTT